MSSVSKIEVLNRLDSRFADLRLQKRGGLVVYVMAGDPDPATGLEIVKGLAEAGVDVIELGMPFSDPMADGPAIQAAAQRSLKAGGSMAGTLDILREFRKTDRETPVVLMGYYNPIYAKGPAQFAREASAAGADGLIVVDLPPEEAAELTVHLAEHGIHLIMLATPTTDAARLPAVLDHAGGFLYYVSIAGITGTATADEGKVKAAIAGLRKQTDLPIAIGFGIKTPEQAAVMARLGDAAVVGSSVVQILAAELDADGTAKPGLVAKVLGFVGELARAVRGAGQ